MIIHISCHFVCRHPVYSPRKNAKNARKYVNGHVCVEMV